jgi:O-antigen/teichoic acid export membrane protein
MSTSVEPPVANTAPDPGVAGWLRRRAVRGGAILMVTRLVTQVFLWSVTLLVARLLLPYDFGLMTSGLIFVGLADLLAEAGVGKALVQKENLQPSDLAEGFTFSLLLSAGLYAVLYLLAGPAAAFLQSPEFTAFLRVLALVVLLIPFKTVPLALLERGLHLGKQSAVHVIVSVAQSGLVLTLAAAGYGYWALATGTLVSRALETAVVIYYSGWRPRLVRPGAGARGLLSFGVHISLGSLLWFVYSNADFAIVGRLAGPEALGLYAFAFQLISLPVQKLTVNVNQVVYPVFCRLQNDRGRMRDWYVRLTVLLGFFGMPVMVGMALVAEDGFALVLGEKWRDAVLPFQLLSLVGVLMIYSHSLPPLFNALGRPDINLKYTAVCTVLFPIGFMVVGLYYGLVGVCLVWLVLYPVLVTTLVVVTRNITGINPLKLLRAQIPVSGAAVFMTTVVMATQASLANVDSTGLRLGASIVLGAGAYCGILWGLARQTVLADVRALWRELKG